MEISIEDIKEEIGQIENFLLSRFKSIDEGSASSEELYYLVNLVKKRNARLIGEIGFNAGFSSYAFLRANPNTKVISFDIGEHPYIKLAKSYIDKKFPGRHKLIYGDSKITIPQFLKKNPKLRFDLIFIDGNHDYKNVKTDLINCKYLATGKTAIVMDDLTPWLKWGKGPTQAWLEAIKEGLIFQEEIYKDGKVVNKIKPPGERSWALGHYIFSPDRDGSVEHAEKPRNHP